MSIASHQVALKTKHAALDAQIETELMRPLPDSAHIQSLKKKKLQIKQALAN